MLNQPFLGRFPQISNREEATDLESLTCRSYRNFQDDMQFALARVILEQISYLSAKVVILIMKLFSASDSSYEHWHILHCCYLEEEPKLKIVCLCRFCPSWKPISKAYC